MRWLRYGTNVSDCKTAEEVLKKADLDWTVEKRHVYSFVKQADNDLKEYMSSIHEFKNRIDILLKKERSGRITEDKAWEEIDEIQKDMDDVYKNLDALALTADTLLDTRRHYSIIKQQTIDGELNEIMLSIVGRQYTPIQNIDAFRFFDALVSRGVAEFKYAGEFKMGAIVWILVKLTKQYDDSPTPCIPHVLLSTSHDGQKSLRITLAPTVNNIILVEDHASATTVAIQHVKNGYVKLAEIESFADLLDHSFEHVIKKITGLREESSFDVEALYDGLFSKKVIPLILDIYKDMPQNKLGACLAVSKYYDETVSSDESLFFGQGAKMLKKTIEKANKMIQP